MVQEPNIKKLAQINRQVSTNLSEFKRNDKYITIKSYF